MNYASLIKRVAVHKMVLYKAFFCAAAIFVLSLGYIYNSGFHKIVINSTTHQQEHLSELYFTDPSSLPKTIESKKDYSLDFTITNFEHKYNEYVYQTIVTSNGLELQRNIKSVKIPESLSRTITIKFTSAAEAHTASVYISLIGSSEHLTLDLRT